MTKEEQVQIIADVLFDNTSTEQLSVEKCYELADKIVERLNVSELKIKEQIKAEIERRRQLIWPRNTGEMDVVDTPKPLEQGWLNALKWMENIIDTMPDESVTDYNDLEREAVQYCFDAGYNLTPRVATDIAKHFYELGQKIKANNYQVDLDTNSNDLDSEIYNWLKEHGSEETKQVIAMTARHFAEWGAKHARKEE